MTEKRPLSAVSELESIDDRSSRPRSGSLSSLSESDSSQQFGDSESDEIGLRTTRSDQLYPEFKNINTSTYVPPPIKGFKDMLPEEQRGELARQLSMDSNASTLNTEARKVLLPDRSEKRYKDNINKRRKILEEISRLKSKNGDISDKNKPSVVFNERVLQKYFEVTDPYAKFEKTSDPFSSQKRLIKISDDLSTYLADKLWDVEPELLEGKFLDLLVIVDDGAVSDKETSFLSEASDINKSLITSAAVGDKAGIFTIPNLQSLEKNGLLDSTIKKTINKINIQRSTLCARSKLAMKSCTNQIKEIAYKIWLSFMALVAPVTVSESEIGGRRTRRHKRNKQNKSKKSKQSTKRSKRRRTNKRRRTHKK
jgi:hypothetical protein